MHIHPLLEKSWNLCVTDELELVASRLIYMYSLWMVTIQSREWLLYKIFFALIIFHW